jgi:mycofactocin precursor
MEMLDTTVQPVPTAEPAAPEELQTIEAEKCEPELVEADLLVEDVSIDGMCGVY